MMSSPPLGPTVVLVGLILTLCEKLSVRRSAPNQRAQICSSPPSPAPLACACFSDRVVLSPGHSLEPLREILIPDAQASLPKSDRIGQDEALALQASPQMLPRSTQHGEPRSGTPPGCRTPPIWHTPGMRNPDLAHSRGVKPPRPCTLPGCRTPIRHTAVTGIFASHFSGVVSLGALRGILCLLHQVPRRRGPLTVLLVTTWTSTCVPLVGSSFSP